jgi:uncharacterized membrane protein
MESHNRSIAKAFSFRILATIMTIVLVLLITGDLKIAGVIGAFDFISKIILFYLHERVWLKIRWGQKTPLPNEE